MQTTFCEEFQLDLLCFQLSTWRFAYHVESPLFKAFELSLQQNYVEFCTKYMRLIRANHPSEFVFISAFSFCLL